MNGNDRPVSSLQFTVTVAHCWNGGVVERVLPLKKVVGKVCVCFFFFFFILASRTATMDKGQISFCLSVICFYIYTAGGG